MNIQTVDPVALLIGGILVGVFGGLMAERIIQGLIVAIRGLFKDR